MPLGLLGLLYLFWLELGVFPAPALVAGDLGICTGMSCSWDDDDADDADDDDDDDWFMAQVWSTCADKLAVD